MGFRNIQEKLENIIFWFIFQEVTLDGAKQAVANYAGSYCQEFNELRNNLDDGCEVLQQVLVSDVPGPQVKLNVGQLEASKRKNFEKLVKSRCLYFKKMLFFKVLRILKKDSP